MNDGQPVLLSNLSFDKNKRRAARAFEQPRAMLVRKGRCKRTLRMLLTEDSVLFGRQLRPPFMVIELQAVCRGGCEI